MKIPMTDEAAPVARIFEVRLARQGLVFTIPPDQSIAAVLLDAGVNLEVCCGQGICGTCLTKVLEGVPEHSDSFLTQEEQALNDQMTLCCSRAKSDLLVLDL